MFDKKGRHAVIIWSIALLTRLQQTFFAKIAVQIKIFSIFEVSNCNERYCIIWWSAAAESEIDSQFTRLLTHSIYRIRSTTAIKRKLVDAITIRCNVIRKANSNALTQSRVHQLTHDCLSHLMQRPLRLPGDAWFFIRFS